MAASLWRIEDGQLRLSFHEGQARAWRSEARFTFVLAGTQSGKTSWGPWWLWREVERTARPEGGNDYIAATATYDLFKLKMLPELRQVFEHTLRTARYWSGDRILELRDPATGQFWARNADDAMWGRIVLRAASSDGGLESLTARGAWLDECGQDEFTVETWEAVLRRLSLSGGRVLGTTTPYNLGWVKTAIYDRWTSGSPDYQVVQFPSYFNPLFPRAEYERARATMPAWRFAMFYDGLFGRPAGLIYDCVDDLHWIEPFALPPEWPRYVGVDFGAVNTALVWVAEDVYCDRLIAYRESLDGGKSTREHCRQALAAGAGENIVAWTGGAPSEDQQRMDWAAEGVPVMQPLISDVEGGIARVYGLLKPRRLSLFNTLSGLRDEMGTYRRKLDPQGQPLEEIQDKRRYHRLDALRYVASVAGRQQVEVGKAIY